MYIIALFIPFFEEKCQKSTYQADSHISKLDCQPLHFKASFLAQKQIIFFSNHCKMVFLKLNQLPIFCYCSLLKQFTKGPTFGRQVQGFKYLKFVFHNNILKCFPNLKLANIAWSFAGIKFVFSGLSLPLKGMYNNKKVYTVSELYKPRQTQSKVQFFNPPK